MKQMDDNQFDLAIVDPPYGIGMDGGYIGGEGKNFIGKKGGKPKNYKKKDWDKNAPINEYFDELIRISKIKSFGAQIISFQNHLHDPRPCWIVWDKKKILRKFGRLRIGFWTSFSTAVRCQFKFKWVGFLQGYGTANKEESNGIQHKSQFDCTNGFWTSMQKRATRF